MFIGSAICISSSVNNSVLPLFLLYFFSICVTYSCISNDKNPLCLSYLLKIFPLVGLLFILRSISPPFFFPPYDSPSLFSFLVFRFPVSLENSPDSSYIPKLFYFIFIVVVVILDFIYSGIFFGVGYTLRA